MNLSWILSAKDVFVCAPCVTITYVIYTCVPQQKLSPTSQPAQGHGFPTLTCTTHRDALIEAPRAGPSPPTGKSKKGMREGAREGMEL